MRSHLKSLKAVVFVTSVIYLLFILFTMIFSGSWHAILENQESGLFLEYLALGGVIIFCIGLGAFFVLVRSETGCAFIYPALAMIFSAAALFAAFYIYWGSAAGITAAGAALAFAGVQVLVARFVC